MDTLTLAPHELWKGTVGGLDVAVFAMRDPQGPVSHVEQVLELEGSAPQDRGVTRPNPTRMEELTGFRVVGGGAKVSYEEPGSMLTAIFPQSTKTWVARAQDHLDQSPATLRGYCVAARLASSDIHIASKTTSRPSGTAAAEAVLPTEYQLVGGGARAGLEDLPNAGTLLTESRPNPKGWNSWVARAKDHEVPSPVEVTAYAIGIRKTTLKRHRLKVVHFAHTGQPAEHAMASIDLTKRIHGQITCGGAKVDYGDGPGNMLTAIYPRKQYLWEAHSKDHHLANPATIAIAVLGLAPA